MTNNMCGSLVHKIFQIKIECNLIFLETETKPNLNPFIFPILWAVQPTEKFWYYFCCWRPLKSIKHELRHVYVPERTVMQEKFQRAKSPLPPPIFSCLFDFTHKIFENNCSGSNPKQDKK